MSSEDATNLFLKFARAGEFKDVLHTFSELVSELHIPQRNFHHVYKTLKLKVNCNEARTLFRLLDKRAGHEVYDGNQTCCNKKVFIIGAGPCGLRMAIEAALLGGSVVLAEMRDNVLRNNVLHLWPFVIHDLKTIGAKVFYPKFCSGNREHISIQRLQIILLKIALVLGVHVFAPVSFKTLVEPKPTGSGKAQGWRVTVAPSGHPIENYEFDMIIGADGKRNCLRVFKRLLFRGKLALGITANFVNEQKQEDHDIDEIGGVFKVFKPDFFAKLKKQGDIDLENFVYFKNDTHYFVYTIKKACLLKKGVILHDKENSHDLLASNNVDRVKLEVLARETASIATDGQLDRREYARNPAGETDVALFDFTALHKADHSCMAVERHGKKLLLAIVGDTLIEPFWPTGSGAGRGFLSVFDAAWMMKGWCEDARSDLEVIAEREGVYKLLSQTAANTLSTNLTKYTIDPHTRYAKSMRWSPLPVSQVKHLYRTEPLAEWTDDGEITEIMADTPSFRMGMMTGPRISDNLLEWFRSELVPYKDQVTIRDLAGSWSNGVALLCLLHKYRPELVKIIDVNPKEAVQNVEKAFSLLHQAYDLSPALTAEEMSSGTADRLSLLTYLVQLKGCLDEEKSRQRTGPTRKPTLGQRALVKRQMSAAGMWRRMSKKAKRLHTDVLPSKPLGTGAPKLPPRGENKSPSSRRDVPVPAPPHQRKPDYLQNPRKNLPQRAQQPSPQSATLNRCQNIKIASSLIKNWEANIQNQGAPTSPKKSATAPKPPPISSAYCAICGRRLLVAERMTSQGYFFHRDCFRCHVCQEPLWTAEATVTQGDESKVLFACYRHCGKSVDRSDGDDGLDDLSISSEDNDDSDDSSDDDDDEDMEVIDGNQSREGPREASLSDWMGAMILDQDTRHSQELHQLGMADMMAAKNLNYVAVGEEESSDEDTPAASPGLDTLRRKKRTLYSLVTSVQLMLGHSLQQELGEVETQEAELEEVGREMEGTLRKKKHSGPITNMEEQVTQEFLQLMEEKRRLQKRQSKLLLKAKLLELQNRHSQLTNKMVSLQSELEDIDSGREDDGRGDDPISAGMKRVTDIGREMDSIERMASEINVFFKDNGESMI